MHTAISAVFALAVPAEYKYITLAGDIYIVPAGCRMSPQLLVLNCTGWVPFHRASCTEITISAAYARAVQPRTDVVFQLGLTGLR